MTKGGSSMTTPEAAIESAIERLDAIVEMVEFGGDIPTEVTIVQNALRVALAQAEAASPSERDQWYTNGFIDGQRGAAPPSGLDVERLQSALWALMKRDGWRIGTGASDLPPNAVVDAIAAEYARLSPDPAPKQETRAE